jgi:hypothetical protein
MPLLAALVALVATDAVGLRLAVDGTCPAAADVRDAILRSLTRAGTSWPAGRRLDLRLAEQRADMSLELFAADGQVLLTRSFRDDAGDCAARAETVGLVVARYLESLGWFAEAPEVRAPAPAPTPRERAWWGVEAGVVLAGGVTGSGGETAVDVGPQGGVRFGAGKLAAALRVGWLAGDTFRSASRAGQARIDRIPVTVTGFAVARRFRWSFAAGPRLVLEGVRSKGETAGLRSDMSLGVRAGAEGEAVLSVVGSWRLGLSAGVDVQVRRIEVEVTDPGTSGRVGVVDQSLVVPFVGAFVLAQWNLGR